jgi:DUF4097 and DUF4098 domain-containing protein YvlB
MSNRLGHRALACALITLPTAGWAQTPIDRRVEVQPDGIVEISNVAGSVEVVAGAQRELVISGTLAADVERLDVVEEDGRVRIEVILSESQRRNPGATHLEVEAPPRSELRVETVSADTEVRGIEGEQRLTTVSGSVTTEGFDNEIHVQSVSGSLTVNGSKRPFRTQARSVSGRVTLQEVAGDVQAETVSGELTVVADTAARAELSSVSGAMSLRARLDDDSRINANSTSGAVKLVLLGNAAADYELSSFSGRIVSCFGPSATRTNGPQQELRFREGTSSARVEVQSMSGRIEVCRE